MDVRMPAVKVIGQLAGCAFDRPGFNLPIVAFDETDEVHELAATNWIMQHMATRPEPVGPDHLSDVGWKASHRHDPSPSNATGEAGSLGAEQAFADLRVNTVRSNHKRRTHSFPGIKSDVHMLVGLGDANAAPGKMECIRLQALDRVGEELVQIATVEHDVGRAVALIGCAGFKPIPGFAGAPVANFPSFRIDLNAAERLLEPKRMKNAGAIRTDLDSGPNFSQPGGLFVHIHVEAAPKQ